MLYINTTDSCYSYNTKSEFYKEWLEKYKVDVGINIGIMIGHVCRSSHWRAVRKV